MKVLFVCLGNICRSPAAEGVFKKILKKEGLESFFIVDSAGTSGYHQGDLADERMREHALKRDIVLDSRSRQLEKNDFSHFNYILVMDDKNMRDVLALAGEEHKGKIKKLTEFCQKDKVAHVPDPYFGGPQGFERVLDIVEDACQGLLSD